MGVITWGATYKDLAKILMVVITWGRNIHVEKETIATFDK